MATKQEFAVFMFRLKKAIPRFAPDLGEEGTLDVWHDVLGELTTVELTHIYKRAIVTFEQFPSIKELLELAGKAGQSYEDQGREVGERIWAAIAKYGQTTGIGESATTKTAAVNAYIGPIGVEVVRMQGGWNYVCELATNDNAGQLKAQWRELGEVIARRGPNSLKEAPQFALSPQLQEEMKKLADKLSLPSPARIP